MTYWNCTRSTNFAGVLLFAVVAVSSTGCARLMKRDPIRRLMNDRSVDVPVDDDFLPPSDKAVSTTDGQVRLDKQPVDSGVRQVAHEEPYVARQVPTVPQGAYQSLPNGAVPNGNYIAPGGQATVQNNSYIQPPVLQNLPSPQESAPVGSQVQYQNAAPPVVRYQNPRPGIGAATGLGQGIVPGAGAAFPPIGTDPIYSPTVREADLIINGFPARTGRITFGAAVNSDAGVTGQITVDERNFDITRWPRSFQDLTNGYAFRGAGQTLRIEAVPGSDFDRYIVNFTNPNLFRHQPISMTIGGFLYDRRFNDWDEQRLGARTSFGYRITPSLSVSAGISGQEVQITRPRASTPQLDAVLDSNNLFSGSVTLKHDTRNTPIQPSRGHYLEATYEQAFGDFDYGRGEIEYRKYWLVGQRADDSGKQTISYSTQLGFSGSDTPIFENFFAGGYATLRGFDFRGASPVDAATQVELGGRFQWLNSVEYMFPITADDAFRGVAFVDFGTVEQDIEINEDNFRVAPGVGLRVAIPMLGPAPLAFDWAFPVAKASGDQERSFSFYMSLVR